MFGKRRGSNGPMLTVLAIVFTVGLVLGAVSLFYIPTEVVSEARATFSQENTVNKTFGEMFKNNFMMEFVWIFAVWILGSLTFTAPFSGVVLSIRGFFVGFSVAFALTGENGGVRFITSYILPQCLLALPVMTVFTVLCIKDSLERKRKDGADVKYFAHGALFIAVTVITSMAETWLTRFFLA